MELPTCFAICIGVVLANIPRLQATLSKDTLVDFKSQKVQQAMDGLTKAAQICTMKSRAMPKDVEAYFTNTAPKSTTGKCFASCMLEASGIVAHGELNRERLLELAAVVNGKGSRLIQKLSSVSRICVDAIDGVEGRCQVAAAYNDCLNRHMTEFSFPEDIAEQVLRSMPFSSSRSRYATDSHPMDLGHPMI